MIRGILFIVLSSISISILAQATSVVSIPFIVEKNCIYFYCKVNNTDSLKFLFDTGAGGSVINKESLNKLSLKLDAKSLNQGSNGINEVDESSGNVVTIGAIVKNDVLLTILPYHASAFDGIAGINLMKGYIIEIDYQKQQLNFYNRGDKQLKLEEYTKLKMYSGRYPTYIKSAILIKGKKYKGFFGLDTGADDALTIASPYARRYDFIHKTPKVGSANFQGSDGSTYEMPIMLFPEIEFAKMHLYRVPAALSNATEGIDASTYIAGFFGNSFLKKFNIILDYDQKHIYFKLNKNLYKDYYE